MIRVIFTNLGPDFIGFDIDLSLRFFPCFFSNPKGLRFLFYLLFQVIGFPFFGLKGLIGIGFKPVRLLEFLPLLFFILASVFLSRFFFLSQFFNIRDEGIVIL